MTSNKTIVAVLGAGGTMGFAMARNLAQAGHGVRAWNRSLEKAQPLTEDGAEVLDTPAEAVEGADVILTMLRRRRRGDRVHERRKRGAVGASRRVAPSGCR